MKQVVLLLVLISISGCQPKTDDLVDFLGQVAANTQPNIEPYPEFKTKPVFDYEASELRSPFQRLQDNEIALVETKNVNCLQPNLQRGKMPLEKYGVDALSIKGFFTSAGQRWAILLTNDGALYKATTGDRLGLFFGEITQIEHETIHFTELLPDGTGCWKQKASKLTRSVDAGENKNV